MVANGQTYNCGSLPGRSRGRADLEEQEGAAPSLFPIAQVHSGAPAMSIHTAVSALPRHTTSEDSFVWFVPWLLLGIGISLSPADNGTDVLHHSATWHTASAE